MNEIDDFWWSLNLKFSISAKVKYIEKKIRLFFNTIASFFCFKTSLINVKFYRIVILPTTICRDNMSTCLIWQQFKALTLLFPGKIFYVQGQHYFQSTLYGHCFLHNNFAIGLIII